MKVGVIGSRNFNNYTLLTEKLQKLSEVTSKEITCIVSGGAWGADLCAERYADEKGIDKIIHHAMWDDMSEPCVKKLNRYGKEYNALAGFKRNTLIVEDSDVVVAFWNGKSKGTKDTINKCKKLNKNVYVVYV
jgi:hypothetical protein